MSIPGTNVAISNKAFSFVANLRSYTFKFPECLPWGFSIIAWGLLISFPLNNSHVPGSSTGTIVYCAPPGITQLPLHESQGTLEIFIGMIAMIRLGLWPWIIMLVAMMFPLLNEPCRHVAFSLKRKDRNIGIAGMLLGYLLTWIIAGIFFLSCSYYIDVAINNQPFFVKAIVRSSGFLLAAILYWLPGRPVKMMKCGQTMPLRIKGIQMHIDTIAYGLKTGAACLNTCWAFMLALLLVQHNLLTMGAISILLIYERYHLPHTSKLPGYILAFTAILIFGLESSA